MHSLNILFLLLLAKHNVLRLLSLLLFLFHNNFSLILANSEGKKSLTEHQTLVQFSYLLP